ncbi:uncharacterized protein [Asterias amurensis]|uniref:uncharacterized protein n=1 Tax=Asterias amurensis TaxID=7602 RepID=UPI003AB6A8D3
MAAEKCLYAYDYVDLKDREYVKKHAKQRHLGDIEGKHRYRSRPSTATVVNSLVNLDFPETRAINTTTAGNIISDQRKQIRNRYQKTQWKETLSGWSRPSSSLEERVQTPVEVEQRPHTSAAVSIPDGSRQLQMSSTTLRPFSTGAIRRPSRKPPQASGFMWVRMKQNGSSSGSKIQFKQITEEIRQQWEEEDKKERVDSRRERSQTPRRYDSFAGQWLSFAAGGMDGQEDDHGNSGGVVDAFTGERNSEYYNIEGSIGANVATQLRIGNKIRVGVNGNVQSDSLRVRRWRKEVESSSNRAESVVSLDSMTTCDSDLFRLSGQMGKPKKKMPTSIVPLCWDEQLQQTDVKVLEAKEKQSLAAKLDLSERHPVVFEKLIKDDARPKRGPKLETYRLSHRTKNKRNLDGTESLGNRITVITVDQIDEDRESLNSMDYEEILQRSLDVEQSPEEEGSSSSLRFGEDLKRGSVVSSMLGEVLLSESEDTTTSGLLEKPVTPRSSPHQSYPNSDTGLTTQSINPKPRSIPLTSPVPSSPSIVSGRPWTGSQKSQRAQSSNSKGRYPFSPAPTPRNLNSPHPNLAKPGQLPRTGVSSINPGVQDGEHEYIKISQQILPGSERANSRAENLAAIARVSERNVYEDSHDDSQSLGQNPSIASFDSVDSMNVEGDRGGNRLPDDVTTMNDPPCSCSPEAKRVMSAAISRVSHSSSTFINIPTADMNTSLSDLNSISDMDPMASYSSFRGSLSSELGEANDLTLEEGDMSPLKDSNDNHLSESNNEQEGLATVSSASSTSSKRQPHEDLGYVINQVDGLDLRNSDNEVLEPERKPASAKKSNRMVTFAEELPSVPNCTPESTPRDPTDIDSVKSDSDERIDSGINRNETKSNPGRPLSAESNQSSKAEELNALRSKIKSDLVETQETTQNDIKALNVQRSNGNT